MAAQRYAALIASSEFPQRTEPDRIAFRARRGITRRQLRSDIRLVAKRLGKLPRAPGAADGHAYCPNRDSYIPANSASDALSSALGTWLSSATMNASSRRSAD